MLAVGRSLLFESSHNHGRLCEIPGAYVLPTLCTIKTLSESNYQLVTHQGVRLRQGNAEFFADVLELQEAGAWYEVF